MSRSLLKTKVLLLTVAVLVLGGVECHGEPTEDSFPVFDAMLYRGKPRAEQLGLRPMRVVYEGQFWMRGQSHDEPNEQYTRAAVRNLPKDALVCLDIECWPVKGSKAAENIRKLIQVVVWVKNERPDLTVGYYVVLPVRDYWGSVRGSENLRYKRWAMINRQLDQLAQHVDVIFPSLYTFYSDQEEWERYAVANLEQAKRYGKPVYVFLWPQYHDSNKEVYATGDWTTGIGYLEPAYWRRELEVCRKHADGIVIWGGWKQQWNDQAPWWLETVQFIQPSSMPSAD